MYTASCAFFEVLWEAGITHCFVNFGSDHPSILEALAKGQREARKSSLKFITCPNEMVALSAAHGMALVTGKPQAVIVHVDVGTQGLGAAVHNASCGRAPVLIFAGLSPFTQEGEMRGSRTEFIHYIQDVPDQGAIVRQYCRYEVEIKTGKNIKQMVLRALQFATSDPKGPVYVCAAREVLEEDIEPYYLDTSVWQPVQRAALPSAAVVAIGEALMKAENPLVVTGYVGRNPKAVLGLVKLANKVPVRVLDTLGSDMCFPASHRSFIGLSYSGHAWITKADVIFVLDCDVPWIPTQCKPSGAAKIFHVDVDPLKQQMPVFYIPAQSRFKADAETALQQLNDYISTKTADLEATQSRFDILEKEHTERLARIKEAAAPRSDGFLSTPFLAAKLKAAIPPDAVFCLEAVTQTISVIDQIQADQPQQLFNSGAGGLGWFGGATLGMKLALDNGTPNSGKFIAAIVGDGTFLFAVPASVYWISRRYRIPFLTVVLDNKGWNAPRRSALLVHPAGYAANSTNEELCIEFSPSPDYAGIAKAASGGEIWAGTAKTVDDLERILKEAVDVVKGGTSAVLHAHIL